MIWQKSTNKGGYPQFNADGAIRLAHRLAYELAHGPIPHGLCVCHTCDNRRCIEPGHLFAGTHGDNNRDMFEKGRGHVFDGTHMLGVKNLNHKLDPEKVREIRRMRAEGIQFKDIAKMFGVTKTAACDAANRKTWAHVE